MSEESQHSILSRLTESEARYRAVIDNASDMIQSVRPDGRFEFVNRAWLEKLGYTEDEVAHMTVWDIIHPDHLEQCQTAFAAASRGEPLDDIEAVFVNRNGEPVPVVGNATARQVDGEVIATHSFFRDVSEHMRAVELEARNARLEQERVAGHLEKMAALGKLAAGLAHELNNPAAAAQRASTRLRESLMRQDAASRSLTGFNLTESQWELIASIADQLHAAGDQTSAMDPLDVSRIEEELERWLDDRNIDGAWNLAPSLARTGFSEQNLEDLERTLSLPALEPSITWIMESVEVDDLVLTIASSTHRISEIVGSVKAYAYMDRAIEQVVDIHEGIENTLIILGHRLKNVTVRKEFDRSIPPVRAFGSGLNQVWTNIIDNAVDAIPDDGMIAIRTLPGDGVAVVEIEDNGCGIPEEHLTRIFEPFFTTKHQGQGAGLGLEMVWRIIIEDHKGQVHVESRPGRTVFRISIPLAGVTSHRND